MTYDDRDPRENPPDPASEPHSEPPPEPIPEPIPEPPAEPIPEPEEGTSFPEMDAQRPEDEATQDGGEAAEEAREAAAEFETAAWPAQDNPADEPAGEPVVDGSSRAAEEWPSEPEGPPPSDIESYQPTPEATEPVMAAHSVPATEPGESTRCPRCGTENRPGIAFCRNCGQRLVAAGAPTTVERPAAPEGTQACPRCGTHNRAGVAFCQNCGANLRAAVGGSAAPASEAQAVPVSGRAILGPIVLLIAAIGVAVAWLLPFPFGVGSLYDRAFGAPNGYGVAFWSGYGTIDTLAQQAYFGFAAAAPLFVALLLALAIAGVARSAPGPLQLIGLVVALVWAIGLATLFLVVEVIGGPGGGVIDILRALTAGGIIFFLASLIVVIGTLTRFGRG